MGSPPFTGRLCGDLSPHRTTMTQTKCCPFFKFGSWRCFSRQTPQESDCEINASFAQGCGCVINATEEREHPIRGTGFEPQRSSREGTCQAAEWLLRIHIRQERESATPIRIVLHGSGY